MGGAADPGRAGAAGAAPAGQRVPQDRARRRGGGCRGRCGSWWRSPPPTPAAGAVLDYEQELRNVLAAVRAARQGAADVRVVPFATMAAIRAELDRGPAHVLHLTGHGSPGTLALEDEDGSARPVTADELADLAVPPGADAAGGGLVGVLHRCGGQPGRGLVRGPAVPARRGGGDRHRDLHHRPATPPGCWPASTAPWPRRGTPTSSPRWRRRAARCRPGCRPHRGGAKPCWPGWGSGRRSPSWPGRGRCRCWLRGRPPPWRRGRRGRGSRGWPGGRTGISSGGGGEQRRWPADLTRLTGWRGS